MFGKIYWLFGGLATGILIGVVGGIVLVNKNLNYQSHPVAGVTHQKDEVIGFLPYWLKDKAAGDYRKYFTTLTYFGLTVNGDGKIKKFDKPGEKEPGWYLLESGKLDEMLNNFKNSGGKLSLLIFSGNPDEISSLLNNPVQSANNLIEEISPILQEHGFTDLNLDMEDVGDASPSAREKFSQFVREVGNLLKEKNVSFTLEISPADLIKSRLTDVNEVAKTADKIVVMGYDYHYTGSLATGPVGPLAGGGSVSEYDVQTAIKLMLNVIPAEKVILGVPVYGYEWETLGESPRSAVIPGTGAVASDRRAEQILWDCASCSAQWDETAQETSIIFKDDQTGTWHQIYYPDKRAMQAKVDLATVQKLGGIAVWALGYEDSTVLQPLEEYRK